MKETAYIEQSCLVDGRRPDSVERLASVVAYLDLDRNIHELARLWPDALPALPSWKQAVALARDLTNELRGLLRFFDSDLATSIAASLPGERTSLSSPDERKAWLVAVAAELARRAARSARTSLEKVLDAIRKCGDGAAHPCLAALAEAVNARDIDAYRRAWDARERIRAEKERLARYDTLGEKLDRTRPGLGGLLGKTAGDPEWSNRVSAIKEAWAWSNAHAWLHQVSDAAAYEEHVRELHRLQRRAEKTTGELVSIRAWRAFFERLDQRMVHSLNAWTKAVGRIGKGTGKFAYRHRRTARRYLMDCVPCIPAWVMPLHRLWDMADAEPGLFDTVIVDEASQASVDALALLLLAKRIIIALQGNSQAHLIEHELAKRLDPETMEAHRLRCGGPAAFQGDERDVIFLSLVVASNVRHRALTTLPDQRRFNVAMSRARDQVRLFHSVRQHDLGPDDLRRRLIAFFDAPAQGAFHRQSEDLDRLEREARSRRLRGNQPEPYESWFEVDVALELLRRRFAVRPQAEVAGYRIDLVVEGDDVRLAVECDGDAWHGAERYEQDMARQRQLERAGWTFVRIRESAWYAEREAAVNTVVGACTDLGIRPLCAMEDTFSAPVSAADNEEIQRVRHPAGTEESHPVDLSSSRSVLHEDSSTNLSGTERRIVDLSDLEGIASSSGLSPEAVRLLVVAATETVAHWALRGHRAVDQMIAQIRVAEGEQRWKLMRPYFATVYEDVRDTFEDEPWVDEMTPESEVRSELREAVAEAEDSMAFREAAPAPEAPAHNEANQAIHGDEAEESDVVDSCDLEDLAFEIGYLVERGVRKAPDVIRAVKEEFGDEWDGLKAHFANEYEIARETFRDEPWVDKMTPEEEVRAAVEDDDVSNPDPDVTELRWNTRYEASRPRLVQRLKALMRSSDEGELHRAEQTIAAIRSLPNVGQYGGSVRIENRVARLPGDSDFIYSLFVGDQGFELAYHERLMMEGGQRDYTDTMTLVRCGPVGWETEEDSPDEEALANMRAVAEMMAGKPFDDEDWQMQVEATREMEEANLPNGIEEWLEMLPMDNEGRCPETVSVEWG